MRQTGRMHRRGRAPVVAIWWLAALCGVAGLGLGGCDGGKRDAVARNGPAPTNNDPGPNDTSNGPVTIQGVVHLDPATGCITLKTDQGGDRGLAFSDYALGDVGGPALVQLGPDRSRTLVAHDRDTLVVTGNDGGGTPAECGTPFTVQSLTSVIPAP
jgi:hypothetical protein